MAAFKVIGGRGIIRLSNFNASTQVFDAIPNIDVTMIDEIRDDYPMSSDIHDYAVSTALLKGEQPEITQVILRSNQAERIFFTHHNFFMVHSTLMDCGCSFLPA